MNSYQKLKKENKRLRDQIFTLVMTPNSTESITLKAAIKMQYDLSNAVWAGETTTTGNKFNGLLTLIKT